jgi:hypothetical protein
MAKPASIPYATSFTRLSGLKTARFALFWGWKQRTIGVVCRFLSLTGLYWAMHSRLVWATDSRVGIQRYWQYCQNKWQYVHGKRQQPTHSYWQWPTAVLLGRQGH